MSRHRPFKRQLKKNPNKEYSESVVVKTNRKDITSTREFGNISFNEEMLTYKTLSGEFEYINDNIDTLNFGVSGLVSDFYTLSTDVSTLSDELSGKVGFEDLIIEKSWSDLKLMRDAGTLVPGQQYRITDYVATVANDSNARSANHPFDLIVVADSESKLNEKARAIRHAGDTYFPASVKFEAWQVWYCLDNDTSRFEWADANGKGVIYRLIDEWRNDCPYDFKGIQFARWVLSNPVGYIYDIDTYEWVEDEGGKLDSFLNVKLGSYGLDNSGTWEFGRETHFKIEYTASENPVYIFTFGSSDQSTSGAKIRENVIRPIFVGNKLRLNNIVFLNGSSDSCYSNTFGDSCFSNTFGRGCHSNTFGNSCASNTFGYNCASNTFGDYCYSNAFGNICHSNTFGNSCTSNAFGNGCASNTFGNNCTSNAFGNGCASNTFGDDCNSNTFGYSCASNAFGYSCYYNTLGDDCCSNTFGDCCCSNTFGDDPLTSRSYFQYITFEPGVSDVLFDCPTTSDSDYCQNITVAKGINMTYIQVLDVNQNYKTTYEATGSQTIEV